VKNDREFSAVVQWGFLVFAGVGCLGAMVRGSTARRATPSVNSRRCRVPLHCGARAPAPIAADASSSVVALLIASVGRTQRRPVGSQWSRKTPGG
jgi:hypothetical protein